GQPPAAVGRAGRPPALLPALLGGPAPPRGGGRGRLRQRGVPRRRHGAAGPEHGVHGCVGDDGGPAARGRRPRGASRHAVPLLHHQWFCFQDQLWP
ncbi:unnamed protein product, partial [Heterosigma akashiwo]